MVLNIIVALCLLLETILVYKKYKKEAIPWEPLLCAVVAAFIFPKIILTIIIIGSIYELATMDEKSPEYPNP